LITAAVQVGAIIGQATDQEFTALTTYGNNIGLAFQIKDDLLNVESTTEELGKAAGSDAAHDKATYPAFFGVEETRKKAQKAVEQALAALENFDKKSDPLRELAQYILYRTK
jgi:geranylgeranyl diphosphate synthase type II